MRLSLTAKSREHGDITILAIIETTLAMGASVVWAIYTDSLIHVVIGACVAPLLLFRSSESTERGKRWFQSLTEIKPVRKDGPFIMFLMGYRFTRLLALSLAIRFFATLRHPIRGFRSIPSNWKRVVWSTDSTSQLELVPGTGPIDEVLQRVTDKTGEVAWTYFYMLAIMIMLFAYQVSMHGNLFRFHEWALVTQVVAAIFFFYAILVMLPVILCDLVCIAYRFSLKSTALFWMPLIYTLKFNFDESMPLVEKVREIVVSDQWKLIRIVSWIILGLFAFKIIILPNIIDWWNAQIWTKVLNFYVMPNQIHTWHVASALNAALALVGYYLFLEKAPRYLSVGKWSEGFVDNGLQVFTLIHTCISYYTIPVGIYLTVVAAKSLTYPEWSGTLFPW